MSHPVVRLGRASEGAIPIHAPPPRACLTICPEFRIYSQSYPNGFWRFCQWLVLGWKWRRL